MIIDDILVEGPKYKLFKFIMRSKFFNNVFIIVDSIYGKIEYVKNHNFFDKMYVVYTLDCDYNWLKNLGYINVKKISVKNKLYHDHCVYDYNFDYEYQYIENVFNILKNAMSFDYFMYEKNYFVCNEKNDMIHVVNKILI